MKSTKLIINIGTYIIIRYGYYLRISSSKPTHEYKYTSRVAVAARSAGRVRLLVMNSYVFKLSPVNSSIGKPEIL